MRQFFPSAMTFFLLLVVLANAWSGERHYTFEDDKAWEVITGEWKIKKGEDHSTKEAKEAIVLLKKNEGVDIARPTILVLARGRTSSLFLVMMVKP